MKSTFLFLTLAIACLLASCSSSARRGGASLGDAAEASAEKAEEKEADRRDAADGKRTRDGGEDSEPLPIGEKVENESVTAGEAAIGVSALLGDGSSPSDNEATPESDGKADRWHITPSFSFHGVAGDAYEMRWGVGLKVGSYVARRIRVEGGAQYVDIEFLDSQDRIRGLERPWELQADVRARFYVTKTHTFAGAYAIVGVKAGIFGWSFVEPVEVQEDGRTRTVSTDHIYTTTFYAGGGIAPVQWSRIHVGGSIAVGIRTFQPATFEGFDNDLFPAVGTWELRLDASYFF